MPRGARFGQSAVLSPGLDQLFPKRLRDNSRTGANLPYLAGTLSTHSRTKAFSTVVRALLD